MIEILRGTEISRRLGVAVVAHRGVHDGDRVRENSRQSLELAVEFGIAAEIDLFFYDSGEVRLLHGPLLPTAVRRAMKAAPEEGLCTLEEALEAVQGRIPLIVEFKHLKRANPQAVRRAIELFRAYSGPVLFSSFDPQVLKFRESLPGIPVAGLAFWGVPEPFRAADLFLGERHLWPLARLQLPPEMPVGLWTYPNAASVAQALRGSARFGIANVTPDELARV